MFTKNSEGELNLFGKLTSDYKDAYKSSGFGGIFNLFTSSKGVSDVVKRQLNLINEELQKEGATVASAVATVREAFGDIDDSIVEFVQNTDKSNITLENFEKSLKTVPSSAGKAAASIKAFALNIGAMAGIMLAVKLGAYVFDQIANRVEHAREALEKSNETYEKGAQELENLQKQLDDTQTKMAELETGGISVVEEDEYNRLVATNKELERNIALQKIANEADAKEAAADAARFYHEKVYGSDAPATMENVRSIANNEMLGQTIASVSENDINTQLGAYVALQKAIADTKAEMDSLVDAQDDASQAQLQFLGEQLDTYEDNLTGIASMLSDSTKDFQQIFDGLQVKIDAGVELTVDQSRVYSAVNQILDLISRIMKDPEVQIDEFIIDKGLKSDISELVNSGKNLNYINHELATSYPELMAVMQECGFTVDDLIKKYQKLSEATHDNEDANVGFDITANSDAIDQFQSDITTIYNSLQKSITGDLTDNEIMDLKQQFPVLVSESDDLSAALDRLANEKIENLIEQMKEAGATDDLLDNLRNIATEARDAAGVELFPASTITDSVKRIATQLEPEFAQLGEAYKSIFTADGFTLDDVDNSMLESLRASFEDIEAAIGVTFDESQIDRFFNALTDGTSTANQVQQAFNDLATSYFYSTEVLESLNEETANAIEQQLEEMGVTNAHEVVVAELAQKELELSESKRFLAETSKELTEATGSEIAQFGAELVASGECSEALALFYLKKAALNMLTISTEADVNNIMALAQAAGVTIESLSRLQIAKKAFDDAVASGKSADIIMTQAALKEATRVTNEEIQSFKPQEIELDFKVPDISSEAGAAGKEAADEYVDQFEQELSRLQDLKDRGKISEKEFLDQLRVLRMPALVVIRDK